MIFMKTKSQATTGPHVHTPSLEQHNKQVALIVKNLESLWKEKLLYHRLRNSTMTVGIQKNIDTRLSQLRVKMQEVPAKDRKQDQYNNEWCQKCLPTE